ncbi:MAG: glutamine synthetase family protein [Nitrolancea sp.]
MSADLREFLEIPYDELEELNLTAKADRLARKDPGTVQEERLKYLADEKRIKAVTVCFSDLEGRVHMLDYDKKFLLKSADNLTFDGSSVRGFTRQQESDLRLAIDWSAFYWLPSDIFAPGKVLVFGEVLERDGTPYRSDMRAKLKSYVSDLYTNHGQTIFIANEIEGILFKGRHAEQIYVETGAFDQLSTSGYYHSLPADPLRQFIDTAAEVQRAMGFQNEKDHPEVAPAQFELNYSYVEALIAADQVMLYKLICRQVADRIGMTASFLPKPVTGVNGNGMHTNMSISTGETNIFWDNDGEEKLSPTAWNFVERILSSALDLCLILNPSVNAYRRLDPHFEAPNQIIASAIDRGAMVRVPIGNERSARIEVRSISPDANPYMVLYSLIRTGLEGPMIENIRQREEILPDNIYDAIRSFCSSGHAAKILGPEVRDRYAELKHNAAERCPRLLGSFIKQGEIQFHHEITNQYLWNQF